MGRLTAEAAWFLEYRAEDRPMDDYDSPWKEALDEYFELFLQLCFPTVHHEIDWAMKSIGPLAMSRWTRSFRKSRPYAQRGAVWSTN